LLNSAIDHHKPYKWYNSFDVKTYSLTENGFHAKLPLAELLRISIRITGTNELLIAEGKIMISGKKTKARKKTILNHISPFLRKIRYKRQTITAGLNHTRLRFNFICR
jgi:hypothetical protein